MRILLIVSLVIGSVGCADLKFRTKNVNGEKTRAEMEVDYRDCYQYTNSRTAYNNCLAKKGYYIEEYTE